MEVQKRKEKGGNGLSKISAWVEDNHVIQNVLRQKIFSLTFTNCHFQENAYNIQPFLLLVKYDCIPHIKVFKHHS